MKVFWDNDEKTILIREFPDQWTWEDHSLSVLQMRQMLQTVNHSVSVIIDGRQIQDLPKDALHNFQSANQNMPPHVMMNILVSNNRLVQDIYKLAYRVASEDFKEFHMVASLEEAYQKIAETNGF